MPHTPYCKPSSAGASAAQVRRAEEPRSLRRLASFSVGNLRSSNLQDCGAQLTENAGNEQCPSGSSAEGASDAMVTNLELPRTHMPIDEVLNSSPPGTGKPREYVIRGGGPVQGSSLHEGHYQELLYGNNPLYNTSHEVEYSEGHIGENIHQDGHTVILGSLEKAHADDSFDSGTFDHDHFDDTDLLAPSNVSDSASIGSRVYTAREKAEHLNAARVSVKNATAVTKTKRRAANDPDNHLIFDLVEKHGRLWQSIADAVSAVRANKPAPEPPLTKDACYSRYFRTNEIIRDARCWPVSSDDALRRAHKQVLNQITAEFWPRVCRMLEEEVGHKWNPHFCAARFSDLANRPSK